MLRAGILAFIVLNAVQLAAQQPTQEKEFRGQDAQRVAAWLKVSLDHAASTAWLPRTSLMRR